jgi:cellulose synthase/poly-beta-1,6-N-acetylglucosamine synthase-like glycosyltransferase
VVIPTYERPESLRRCLEGFARLDHPSWELIVVNDGGAASFARVDDGLRSRLPIRLVDAPHRGPASARNTGARAAAGSFLAFTDDDCTPEPDWLTELERGFDETPADALGGDCLNPYPDNAPALTWQLYLAFMRDYLRDVSGNALLIPSNNAAYRSEVFWSVEGFDESFPMAAGEDLDLGFRIVERGYRQILRDSARIWHHHRTTVRGYLRQQYRYGQGTLDILAKRYVLRLPERRSREYFLSLARFLRKRRAPLGVWLLTVLTPFAHRAGIESLRLRRRREHR